MTFVLCLTTYIYPEDCISLVRTSGEQRRGASSCVGCGRFSFDRGSLCISSPVTWTPLVYVFSRFTFSRLFARVG